MAARRARALGLAGIGLCLACDAATPARPPLSREEALLVDLYVQITRLEQARLDHPDSATAGFASLAADFDSTAVQRGLAALEAAPQRWEFVLDEIARRLRAAEEDPNPTPPWRSPPPAP